MRFGHDETCLEHDTGPRHPETPDRVRAIRKRLSRKHGVRYYQPGPASVESVKTLHDPGYVASLREFCEGGGGEWDPDTVAVKATWDAALASAGLACWVAREAVEHPEGGDVPFSIGRPPGHHAVGDDAMGFCFFNNAGIAAQHAIDRGDADRVAIFDWDVHHGNGTQDVFYDRGDVFYASVHEEGLYPGTGGSRQIGTGAGEGTTMNVPLQSGAGDGAYATVVEDHLKGALTRFDPDLLLISAGFDAHRHDPISRMQVSSAGYGILADRVRDIAAELDAGLGFILEGGYSLDMLAEGIGTVHEVFHGREPIEPETDLDSDIAARLDSIREIHGL
jgi:acetoin utilization deacetylase AcuC-like enzyme